MTAEARASSGSERAPTVGVPAILRRAGGIFGFSVVSTALDGLSAVVVARQLGSEGRGVYAIVLTLAGVAAALGCFGVPTAGRVRLASPDAPLDMAVFASAAPFHAVAGGVVSSALVYGLAVVAIDVGPGSLAFVAGALTCSMVLSTFGFEGLHGVGRQRSATAVNALGSTVMLAATLLLAWQGGYGPAAYLLVFAGSQVVQVLAAGILLHRRRGLRPFRPVLDRELLRAGLPAMPYQLSAIATFRLDRYIVGALAGVSAAGIYAVAATVSEMARMVPTAVGQVLLYGRSSSSVSAEDERRSRRIVLLLTWVILLVLGIAAPALVSTLFGPEFESAVGPLRILLVGEAFLAAWFIDNRLLVGSGRLGAASATTGIAAIVVIAADLALIPPFELTGAAVASVGGYATAWYSARRLLRQRTNDLPA
jgi:O-antigen/teichoic acid export membrane protein